LLVCWWRGEEGFCVRGKEIAAVWGIEAFWEDDYVGARGGGFEDFVAGVREVLGFVCACGARVLSAIWSSRGRSHKPDASCTRASFTGFLSRFDMVATVRRAQRV
jgi:hypothetical protein